MIPDWVNQEQVLEFVMARHKPDGGFAMTPLLPATVEDTYYAVRILQLLKCPLPKTLKDYVLGLEVNSYTMPKNLYQLASLYEAVKERPPIERLLKIIGHQETQSLESLSYLLRLLDLIGVDNLKSDWCQQVPDHWRILKDLYYLIGCAQVCEIKLPSDEVTRWVQHCQNGDGGFGFMPFTTSFLENVYYALRILSYFHKKPARAKLCLNFIRCCYVAPKGAFARSPNGVAFLESTYHGLTALFLLND